MSAWDDQRFPFLAKEASLLAEAAKSGLITLGICLGAQLLARGLGARVYTGPQPELGIGKITLSEAGKGDRLLQPFDGKEVLHWHADTFDLPDGAELLASSERYVHQAFRWGKKAYGLQFHVECDIAQRRQWAKSGERELRALGVQPTSLTAFTTNAIDDRGRAFAGALLRLA
jgi:GMP synthase (glutamine-hydrolysing)